MSSLHYFANRYRNRVSRKREFFNLYKTVFVILNMQKAIRFLFSKPYSFSIMLRPKHHLYLHVISAQNPVGYFRVIFQLPMPSGP